MNLQTFFRRLALCLTVLSTLLGSFPVFATMVLPLDLRQMTDQSGRIFVGHCDDVSQELDENGLPVTYVRLTVAEGVKGAHEGESILIKQYGTFRHPDVREGESAILPVKTMALGGGPYQTGRDYLLFLYPESVLGFTSPVGAGQGRFEVTSGKSLGPGQQSVLTVVNPLDNQFLKSFSKGPADLDQVLSKVRGYLRSDL